MDNDAINTLTKKWNAQPRLLLRGLRQRNPLATTERIHRPEALRQNQGSQPNRTDQGTRPLEAYQQGNRPAGKHQEHLPEWKNISAPPTIPSLLHQLQVEVPT